MYTIVPTDLAGTDEQGKPVIHAGDLLSVQAISVPWDAMSSTRVTRHVISYDLARIVKVRQADSLLLRPLCRVPFVCLTRLPST